MKRCLFMWVAVACAGFVFSQNKPNIVVILADDLGYGDLKCYNPERSKIDTPHLSRLAEQGMRFTDAHSSSGVCSPSRYALLTGRYHWRSRLQTGIVGVMEHPLIASNRLTIAGLARNNGYTTACIGKWHLGMGWGFEEGQQKQAVALPMKPGDDEAPLASDEQKALWKTVFSKPITGGPLTAGFERYFGTDVPNWPPFCFVENDRTVGVPETFISKKLLHTTPHLISRQGPGLKDWNVYEILPTIGKKACAYVREQSATKKPFMLYMPLTSPHEPIAVNEAWKGKSKLHYYADFVMETDDVIGSVLKTIDECGIADNTIVIFTSDNGKASYTGLAELQQLGHYSSGPLRGCKTSVYEGGHRMPFIVRWPGHVKPGSTCNQLVHHTDVIATLSDILNAPLPADAGVDSFSFLSLLKGADKPTRQSAVSCAASGVPGFRSGDWKLVLNAKPELYNLAKDIGETTDLAAQEPERVKEMQAQLETIISEGRSTPGEKQANDVQVIRYPKDENPQKVGRKANRKAIL